MQDRKEFIIAVVLTVGTTFAIAFWPWPAAEPMKKVQLAIAYGMLILLFLFGFLIVAAIASGKIDISKLLEEMGGGASMSRFQLLIFTFVIALSLFLVVVCKCEFPKTIPPEILTLLGISASTYGVSKGIQAGSDATKGTQAAAPQQPTAAQQTLTARQTPTAQQPGE